MGENVASKQIRLRRVRISGEDERLDAHCLVAAELAEHLVGVADDGRAAA